MNKKLKIFLSAILVVLMLALCGCQNAETPETAAPTEAPTAAPTEAPTAAPTAAPTEAPTEELPTEDLSGTEPPVEPVVYTNPLTGETMDTEGITRITAVSINNVRAALPHVGVAEADLFFEMYINDYATRGLALYHDIRDVEVVGSVRSWRYNFTDIALAYDTLAAHAGGSGEVLSDAYSNKIDHVNIDGREPSFRDKDRRSKGYATEHTLMLKGPEFYSYMAKKGIEVVQESAKTYGLNFVENGAPEAGDVANKIDITFRLDGNTKLSTMTYDETLGGYIYTQYGQSAEKVKEADREVFENVFVILTKVSNKGVYHVANLNGSGDGYFACGGKIIPIKWHNENEGEPFTFTLEDGLPLYQGVGNSYIAICPTKSTVAYE